MPEENHNYDDDFVETSGNIGGCCERGFDDLAIQCGNDCSQYDNKDIDDYKPQNFKTDIKNSKPNKDIFYVDYKYIRSYEVGLREPEQKIKPITNLMRKRQVLKYISQFGANFNEFKRHINIANAQSHIVAEYEKIFDKYSNRNILDIIGLLSSNLVMINQLKKYTTPSIELFELNPKIDLNNCSLRDYRLNAAASIVQLNRHFNIQALNFIDFIKLLYKGKVNQPQFSRAFRAYLHNQSNNFDLYDLKNSYITWCNENNKEVGKYFATTLQKHITPLIKGYSQTLLKIKDMFKILSEDILTSSTAVFLVCNQVPRFLRDILSKSWNNLNPVWVRNSLVGWRRKFDKDLPSQLQVELLTSYFNKYVEFLKFKELPSEYIKIVRIIQKHHCLHLLRSHIDLSPLFNSDEKRQKYRELVKYNDLTLTFVSQKLINNSHFKEILTTFTLSDIIQAGEMFKKTITSTTDNSQRFRKKINAILETFKHDFQKYRPFFENYVCGRKFTDVLSKILAKDISNYSQLFTALRGIIAFAYARKYNFFGETGIVRTKLNGFDPSKCATFPFCSPKRKKRHISFHSSSQNPLKVKEDKNNIPISFIEGVTDRFKNHKNVWIDIPMHREDQINNEGLIKTHSKADTIRLQLIPSKKILQCLKRGAYALSLIIEVPTYPNYKIRAHISLGANKREVFQHATKFIKVLDKKLTYKMYFPKTKFLGSDFNELGKYMIALGTPTEEIDLKPLLKYLGFMRAKEKLQRYSEIKSEIQKKYHLLKNNPPYNFKVKKKSLETQFLLLNDKETRIYRDILIKLIMVYVYIGKKTGAEYFGWDDISNLSTRGLKGRLASAVTYLPRQDGLRGLFIEWAKDCGILTNSKKVVNINPHTSKICYKCGKRTIKSLNEDYHIVRCSDCGHKTIRHQNSACVSSQNLKKKKFSS